jgi:hypothetical protein
MFIGKRTKNFYGSTGKNHPQINAAAYQAQYEKRSIAG